MPDREGTRGKGSCQNCVGRGLRLSANVPRILFLSLDGFASATTLKSPPPECHPQVVAVVNGREKADFLRRLGVDAVVDASSLAPAGGGDKGQPLHKAIKAVAPKGETLLNWRHHTFEWRYVCAP